MRSTRTVAYFRAGLTAHASSRQGPWGLCGSGSGKWFDNYMSRTCGRVHGLWGEGKVPTMFFAGGSFPMQTRAAQIAPSSPAGSPPRIGWRPSLSLSLLGEDQKSSQSGYLVLRITRPELPHPSPSVPRVHQVQYSTGNHHSFAVPHPPKTPQIHCGNLGRSRYQTLN